MKQSQFNVQEGSIRTLDHLTRFIAGAGWQQRFDKVHDALELRVGHASGPLISWRDRGNGRQYTWVWSDPVGEIRDITPWVGSGDKIFLWARIIELGATHDHQCDMDTLFAGVSKQRWEFDEDEDHEIDR